MYQTFRHLCWTVRTTCVAAVLFCSLNAVHAAEWKPFLTLRCASPETLVTIVEKFADLAGAGEVKETLAPFKSLKGIDAKGNIGFAVIADKDKELQVIAVLPITNIEKLSVPGYEMFLDDLKDALTKDGKGYLYKSPFGNYAVQPKKGYIVVAPEKIAAQIPDDPQKLFAELEECTVGLKINFDNADPETIESLLAPLSANLFLAGNNAFESLQEGINEAFKEFTSYSAALSVDANTLDINMTFAAVPRKGSDSAKQIAAAKNIKTAFSGFRGNPEKTIFYASGAQAGSEAQAKRVAEQIDKTADGTIEGIIGSIDDEDKADKVKTFIEGLFASYKNILVTMIGKGTDTAFSFDSDGTFLAALSIVDTDELTKLSKNVLEFVKENAKENPIQFDIQEHIEKYVTKDYATVAGYKVSKFVLPLKEVLPDADNAPAPLKAMTVAGYWAVKKNDSIALAFGFDKDAVEEQFKEALETTQTPAEIQQPAVMLSAKPIGKLLQQRVLPIVATTGDADSIQRLNAAIKILSQYGNKAKLEIISKDTEATAEVKIAGQLVKTIVALFNIETKTLDRKGIRDLEE